MLEPHIYVSYMLSKLMLADLAASMLFWLRRVSLTQSPGLLK